MGKCQHDWATDGGGDYCRFCGDRGYSFVAASKPSAFVCKLIVNDEGGELHTDIEIPNGTYYIYSGMMKDSQK